MIQEKFIVEMLFQLFLRGMEIYLFIDELYMIIVWRNVYGESINYIYVLKDEWCVF